MSSDQASVSSPARPGRADGAERPFRFYDNRQTYLMFVNTCNEKWVVAERIGKELKSLKPAPPALRVFDGGTGDGTILATVMRGLHRRFPNVPLCVVAKEISLEDVRLCLEKMPDRLAEHPASVVVLTNLYYGEAPKLMPSNVRTAAALNWHEIALTGDSAYDYDEQIKALGPLIADSWQVTASRKTGNPLYVRPSVLVLYRKDQAFLLDSVIPRPGAMQGLYDLIIASQPYRARTSAALKVRKVLAPLASALGPSGRMLVIQSHGRDPGMEIVNKVWPEEDPFQSDRHALLKTLKQELSPTARDLAFNAPPDERSLFQYRMHSLPSDFGESIGTSALFAAWNAAVYVAQIEGERLSEAMKSCDYLAAAEEVLHKHGGLWFWDESFVITRRGR